MKIINHTRYSKFTLRQLARQIWARAIGTVSWWDQATLEIARGGTHAPPHYNIIRWPAEGNGAYLMIIIPPQTVYTHLVAEAMWKGMIHSINGDWVRTDFGFVTLRFGPALVERQPKIPSTEEKISKALTRVQKSIFHQEKKIRWSTTYLKTLRKKEASLKKKLDACRKVE